MATRQPREMLSRASEMRDEFAPPDLLPTPTPEPGFKFRWIATHNQGEAQPTNVSRKMRTGWVPVRAEDHPELMVGSTGNVEISGLMLCKMPEERVQARSKYYNNRAAEQMQSVDSSYLNQNDPRMPKFRKSKTSVSRSSDFGSGN
jgi:hypothetical protein